MKHVLFTFLCLLFSTSVVFAQSSLEKKITTAGNLFKNEYYSDVIETLKEESQTDYRVAFFVTASRYEILKSNNFNNPEEIYKVKRRVNDYLEKFVDKRENFTQIIYNYSEFLGNNFPPTLQEFYVVKAQKEAEEKERIKLERIDELKNLYSQGRYLAILNQVNGLRNSDIELYHLEYYEAIGKFGLLKSNNDYHFYNDLLPARTQLENYISKFGEVDSFYTTIVERDLAELNRNYPNTYDDFVKVKAKREEEAKQQKIAKEMEEIRSKVRGTFYHSAKELISKYSGDREEEEYNFYKTKVYYKIFSTGVYKNFNDFHMANTLINNYLRNKKFTNSNYRNEIEGYRKDLDSNYPKTQDGWARMKKKEAKEKERKIQKTTKSGRSTRSKDSFIAIGYEGGTVAKYGLRFEVGGRTLGFFLNARTSLISDKELFQNIDIKNRNEAIVGINLKLSKWLFLNLGSGYGFYKEMDFNNNRLEAFEYFPAYGGLTIRLGNRFNLIGGTSFIDIGKEKYWHNWYNFQEYTFGLTINLR